MNRPTGVKALFDLAREWPRYRVTLQTELEPLHKGRGLRVEIHAEPYDGGTKFGQVFVIDAEQMQEVLLFQQLYDDAVDVVTERLRQSFELVKAGKVGFK